MTARKDDTSPIKTPYKTMKIPYKTTKRHIHDHKDHTRPNTAIQGHKRTYKATNGNSIP